MKIYWINFTDLDFPGRAEGLLKTQTQFKQDEEQLEGVKRIPLKDSTYLTLLFEEGCTPAGEWGVGAVGGQGRRRASPFPTVGTAQGCGVRWLLFWLDYGTTQRRSETGTQNDHFSPVHRRENDRGGRPLGNFFSGASQMPQNCVVFFSTKFTKTDEKHSFSNAKCRWF